MRASAIRRTGTEPPNERATVPTGRRFYKLGVPTCRRDRGHGAKLGPDAPLHLGGHCWHGGGGARMSGRSDGTTENDQGFPTCRWSPPRGRGQGIPERERTNLSCTRVSPVFRVLVSPPASKYPFIISSAPWGRSWRGRNDTETTGERSTGRRHDRNIGHVIFLTGNGQPPTRFKGAKNVLVTSNPCKNSHFIPLDSA